MWVFENTKKKEKTKIQNLQHVTIGHKYFDTHNSSSKWRVGSLLPLTKQGGIIMPERSIIIIQRYQQQVIDQKKFSK